MVKIIKELRNSIFWTENEVVKNMGSSVVVVVVEVFGVVVVIVVVVDIILLPLIYSLFHTRNILNKLYLKEFTNLNLEKSTQVF